MDYFVSIENIPYHRWQLELLIESFKMHDLQDKLLVAIAENNEPQYGGFARNMMDHERKFIHENYGKSHGCKELNKPYALLSALSNNFLSQPFVVLHPDMVLYKPFKMEGQNNFLFSVESETPALRQRLQPYIEKVVAGRAGDTSALPWLSANCLCAFNSVSMAFFTRVMHHMEVFLQDHSDWEDIPQAAWITALYEQYGLALIQGGFYECPLVFNVEDIPNACVIHYRFGVPPYFSKKHFRLENSVQFSLSPTNPLDVLEQYDNTTAMEFMSEVVKSYKNKKPYEATPSNPSPPEQTPPMKIPSELIEPNIK